MGWGGGRGGERENRCSGDCSTEVVLLLDLALHCRGQMVGRDDGD